MEHLKRNAAGVWQFDPYFAYLASVRDRVPEHVYAFASDWAHYALDSPRSLHDSWIEELSVREHAAGPPSGGRQTEITLRFLGPMHDRIQVLRYSDVQSYRVTADETAGGHGDLLVHELRLDEHGTLVHELLFASGAAIVVQFADLVYEDHLNPSVKQGTA
jgi:hypothetical protein